MTTALVPTSTRDALADFGDPAVGLTRAKAIATELATVIDERNWAVTIGKGKHLRIEAWLTLGSMVGCAPKTESITEIRHPKTGDLEGYIARVEVVRFATGEVIGAAECGCFYEEEFYGKPRWSDRHAVISMAQTRASSKALGAVLRWIPELAGFNGTPAEEMPPDTGGDEGNRAYDEPPPMGEAKPQPAAPGGKLSEARIKQLGIYRASFKAAEAVHGKPVPEDAKFKPLNWALGRMGFGRVSEVPDDRGEELASLIPEYAQATDDEINF